MLALFSRPSLQVALDGGTNEPIGIRPGLPSGSLLAGEADEIFLMSYARYLGLDCAAGVEGHVREPIAERPFGLTDVQPPGEVLGIGKPGRHDHDVVVVDEAVVDQQGLQLPEEKTILLGDTADGISGRALDRVVQGAELNQTTRRLPSCDTTAGCSASGVMTKRRSSPSLARFARCSDSW